MRRAFIFSLCCTLALVAQPTPSTIDRAKEQVAAAEQSGRPATVASAYRSLGAALAAARRFDEAAIAEREVLNFLQSDPDTKTSRLMVSHATLAIMLFEAGRWSEARPHGESAVALADRDLPPLDPQRARLRYVLAGVLSEQGNAPGAIQRLQEAMKIYRQTPNPRPHEHIVRTLLSLAELQQRAGQYEEARECLEEATSQTAEHSGVSLSARASIHATFGSLESSLGRHGESRVHFQQQLALLGPSAPAAERAIALRCIAHTLLSEGKLSEAESPLKEALTLLDSDSDPARHVATLLDAASLAAARGQGEVMADYGTQALRIAREGKEPRVALEVFALFSLGRAQHALGDLNAANESLRLARTLTATSLGRFHRQRPRIESALGRVLQSQGQADLAEKSHREALRLVRERLVTTGSGLPEAERHALLSDGRSILDAWLSCVVGRPHHAESIAEEVLQWHGQVLHAVHADRALLRLQDDPIIADLRSQLVQVLERLDATELVRSSRAPASSKTKALVAEREALERALLRAAPSALMEARTVAEVCAELSPSEAIVQWFVWQRHEPEDPLRPGREERMLGIVLRQGRQPHVADLGTVAEMQDAVLAYGTMVRRWTRPDDQAPAIIARVGRINKDRIMGPLQGALQGVTRLIAIPDGLLLDFPFGALPGQEKDSFLLEDVEIVYGTRALESKRPTVKPSSGVLLVGAVEYGQEVTELSAGARVLADRLGLPLPHLPGSAREVDLAAASLQHFDSSLVQTQLLGREATEEAVKASIEQKRIIHFATHGVFLADTGRDVTGRRIRSQLPTAVSAIAPSLRCGIALANANQSATQEGFGEGILTASEIAWLNLSSCELVTISGCETGLGTPFPGEGLFGLRRSLRLAGARSTVSAVFSVRDQDTAVLMADFYATLAQDLTSPGRALRSAQRTMLRACREEHGQALTGRWAAWILESAR